MIKYGYFSDHDAIKIQSRYIFEQNFMKYDFKQSNKTSSFMQMHLNVIMLGLFSFISLSCHFFKDKIYRIIKMQSQQSTPVKKGLTSPTEGGWTSCQKNIIYDITKITKLSYQCEIVSRY